LAMMSVLLSFLLTLRTWARSRAALQLEVLALQHQLQVLQRTRVPTEYSVPVETVGVADDRLIPFPGRMTALFIALLAALRTTIRSRLELAAEVLALRH